MAKLRIALLGSTRGSLLQPLVEAIKTAQLEVEVVVVISDQDQAGILQVAEKLYLPYVACVKQRGESRREYDQRLSKVLHQFNIEFIVLIGFMRILSPELVNAWPQKIINTHPSLLPRHGGLMDLAVHQSVIDAGDSWSGCTVHFVEAAVDEGEILFQSRVAVCSDETALSLKEKVQKLEVPAIIDAIRLKKQEQI